MYCKNRAFKSPAFNEWSSGIFHRLSSEENLQAMKNIREFFNPATHAVHVDLKFYYPSNILYTKKGSVSAKSHDISNVEKPLIDLIFLPTYYNKSIPYGCPNLNMDDKYITSMRSQKLAADEHRIEIELQIVHI